MRGGCLGNNNSHFHLSAAINILKEANPLTQTNCFWSISWILIIIGSLKEALDQGEETWRRTGQDPNTWAHSFWRCTAQGMCPMCLSMISIKVQSIRSARTHAHEKKYSSTQMFMFQHAHLTNTGVQHLCTKKKNKTQSLFPTKHLHELKRFWLLKKNQQTNSKAHWGGLSGLTQEKANQYSSVGREKKNTYTIRFLPCWVGSKLITVVLLPELTPCSNSATQLKISAVAGSYFIQAEVHAISC